MSQGTAQSYFEDGYQDSAHERSSPEAPSIERGNKLLSFKASVPNADVLGFTMRPVRACLSAQLHGMFFLAESSRTATGEFTTNPPELTCYRRNLFQITGSVTLPRLLQYAVSTETGERPSIVSSELAISATESVEGSSVKIISVPWKTQPGGTPPSTEEKTEREPSSIALDQSISRDVDTEYSVYPIAWKRLQFRVATANNGRRKELQQHFTIKLSVMATLENGEKISLCDAVSGPVIVRGRSPRNFQARKDVPLSGCGASIRKAMSALPPAAAQGLRRSATAETLGHQNGAMESGANGVTYTMPPARHESPAGSVEWKAVPHTGNPPVDGSPYTSNSPLKRKIDDTRVTGQLAGQQPGTFAHHGSVPPQEPPRKMLRSRGQTVGGELLSPSSTQPSHSLPTTSFTFPAAVSAPAFYDMKTETANSMGEYFGEGNAVDPWLPTATGPYYRPAAAMHASHVPPVTSVGGAMLGNRAHWGEIA